ncbi:MAG: alpha/beta fold hydrolase [archaeon]|nr:alpha/beta fold hydrolase [archaeon]
MASCSKVIQGIVLLPFIILFVVFFLALIVVYLVTLVGPVYHFFRGRHEKATYLDMEGLLRRHRDLHTFRTARGNIAYRWTVASGAAAAGGEHAAEMDESVGLLAAAAAAPTGGQPRRFPVVQPGGLGSTLAAVAFLHDGLVAQGFDVLTFDRLGVGYSDDVDAARHAATMQAHVDEMHALLLLVDPSRPWILVGGSFGSTVGQLYAAQHPDRVAGFVNLDGLPYYLSTCEGSRESFSKSVPQMYAMEANVSATGFFRFPLWLASVLLGFHEPYARSEISYPEVYAQLQHSRLLSTIQHECPLMMDCCDALIPRWGALSASSLPADVLLRLASAPPAFTHLNGVTTPASQADAAEIEALRQLLQQIAAQDEDNAFLRMWQGIPVVSISCTNYWFDPSESFLTAEMRRCYSAEHTLLALVSSRGERWVFPEYTHLGTLTLKDQLFRAVLQVSDLASHSANLHSPSTILLDLDADDVA